MKKDIIPFVEAKGTNYDIGVAIGESLREKLIQHSENVHEIFSKISQEKKKHMIALTKYLIHGHFPRYFKELKGMADAANLSIEDIVLMGSEETIFNQCKEKCSTFAFSCKGRSFLAHNEDWAPGYEDMLYIVKAKPDEGNAFLSLSYIGSLGGTSVALSSAGIAFSGNSILTGYNQPGIPKSIILRGQIDATTLKEFEKLATYVPRAIPNHSMAIDCEGKIISVEVALDKQRESYFEGYFAHTNHPIFEGISHLEKEECKNSKERLRNINDLFSKDIISRKNIEMLLKSHGQGGLCRHAASDDYNDVQTIASVIVDVKKGQMMIAKGNPCSAKYRKYKL